MLHPNCFDSDFFSSGVGDLIHRNYEIKGQKRLRSSNSSLDDTSWVIERVGSCELASNVHEIFYCATILTFRNSDIGKSASSQGTKRQQ